MTDPSSVLQWRDMDAATRAAAYSPSSVLDGPLGPYIDAYVADSRAAYAACPGTRTLRYGPADSNTVDVVTPDSTAPVPLHVFLHGGYWQELSKRESFFPAVDTLARGMGFAAVDYTLAPQASLDTIVEECCAAIAELARQAAALNVDPARMVLSGSSAGAHLAAMCCLRLSPDLLPAGVLLLSGVYEIEPLIGTYINDALGLDRASAARNSPASADLRRFPPAVIAWGAQETEEFKRQSRHFAARLAAAGRPARVIEVAWRNHFDIVHDLAADTELGRALSTLANPTG